MESIGPLVALTLATALAATVLVAPMAIVLGWVLVRKEFPGKSIIETIVLLPLVLPPVATGLILLDVLGRRGLVGGFLHQRFDLDIAFTWRGVIVAMAIMAAPLFVLTARAAFEAVDPRLEQVAATLGSSPIRVFTTVTLPLAWPGLLGAAVLAFARAIGEFGATMLLAGAIPGRTATLSTAIWTHVQAGDDAAATRLMVVSVILALGATAVAGWLTRRTRHRA